jgi:hypothetical protein
VSKDSLQAFRDARQAAGYMPRDYRVPPGDADIAAESFGNPIRELADRLAEEAARAAEYRVRLQLTEQAASTVRAELEAELEGRSAGGVRRQRGSATSCAGGWRPAQSRENRLQRPRLPRRGQTAVPCRPPEGLSTPRVVAEGVRWVNSGFSRRYSGFSRGGVSRVLIRWAAGVRA